MCMRIYGYVDICVCVYMSVHICICTFVSVCVCGFILVTEICVNQTLQHLLCCHANVHSYLVN